LKGRWLRRPGALALVPDGVPPPALALRGESLLYWSRRAVNFTCCRAADADLGTNKMGSGAYGTNGVQGQSPWPCFAHVGRRRNCRSRWPTLLLRHDIVDRGDASLGIAVPGGCCARERRNAKHDAC
jgi:hypothetical protein